ncbi:MAG: SGNH/GDSL hydrolase family protein [Clostridia bacterium]|nr:SGNH/GDSL hydrolase family protein [Clostridia bacterium]
MKKILFQGDSITDAQRNRENDLFRGSGYATLVSASLGYKYPEEYEFVNRGISGNRIVDLYQRIKCDFINLAPDYISILIGINDVWHEAAYKNGVSPEKFEKIYNMLIEELKEALPDVKVMILEPFVLKAAASEGNWDYFKSETKKMADASRRVAEKNALPFIPLYNEFFELAKTAPASYWLVDGVHPSAAGHEFIKNKWIETFERIK